MGRLIIDTGSDGRACWLLVFAEMLRCRGPVFRRYYIPYIDRMRGERSDDGASAAHPLHLGIGSAGNAACEEMK